ncbi:HD-GYP domain-containing protein [Bdellovibrio svalbardensis]|uniref:HD-GYP domain-containing protein n=1 Tax=Bdellovibrio svalbardensis TaxID=2972972 RepID=A0ABT6DH05_9BACT|nr:HD-GYP domain-containing protein [Bdellovibrio svalbardensis]MDG0816146.1 HD-GYP domain-containing protein [Bdellovibrio svalbardensis]
MKLRQVLEGMKGDLMSSSWGDIPAWAYESAQALMQALKIVDPVTYAHCCRVGEMSRKLARDSGLNEYEQKLAEFAGLFHDIGKMGVSQDIIAKPGKLDDRELAIMKSHPVLSEEIVQPLAKHNFFAGILPGIRGHHERVDGTGYPDKKLGDEIPVLARIILVVDTYDAMSQTRAYRKGLPDDVVYEELKRCSGTQFDSQLVNIFLKAHPGWKTQESDQETLHQLIKKVA